mmetsp:Transcript_26011/g.64994  ORF Transcript_26011/g.64994 Transcript_26011/m.64994 type:complete len:203 (+) Transcript_26011:3-611(+)
MGTRGKSKSNETSGMMLSARQDSGSGVDLELSFEVTRVVEKAQGVKVLLSRGDSRAGAGAGKRSCQVRVTFFNALGQTESEFLSSDVVGSGATIKFVEPLVLKGYSEQDREGRLKVEAFFKDNKKSAPESGFVSIFEMAEIMNVDDLSVAKPYRSKKFGAGEVRVCGDFLDVNALKKGSVNFATQLKSVAQSRNIKWMQRCF